MISISESREILLAHLQCIRRPVTADDLHAARVTIDPRMEGLCLDQIVDDLDYLARTGAVHRVKKTRQADGSPCAIWVYWVPREGRRSTANWQSNFGIVS